MSIRIENFPSFVTSKAPYGIVGAVVNDTKWFIVLDLKKFCQNENKYIRVTPSSNDQPEALGARIFGERSDQKDSSYIVTANFKFKHPSMAKGFRFLATRFDLNSKNGYHKGRGVYAIAKIDVINFIFLLDLEIFIISG